MQLTHIRNLNVSDQLSSGHRHASAASGLVRLGASFAVVADDEHHLAIFDCEGDAPGHLLRLLPGNLPRKKKKRKAVKPDFEILFALPSSDGEQNSLLCALGSGSTPQRMRGTLISAEHGLVASLDLKPLFRALALLVDEINLEGAAVRGDRLLLFNRGNMANAENLVFETGLSTITGHKEAEIALVKRLTLPAIDGVPLTVTDACLLDDGRILLSAVAEVTDDSYADGAILGSAIIVLDTNYDVILIEHLQPVVKIEGISAQRTVDGIAMLCVSDADDPGVPASLYSAILEK